MRVRHLLIGALLALPATSFPAFADRASHDEARRAVQNGEVKPLAEIMQMVQPSLGGDILGVELERGSEGWVYEFRFISREGRRGKAHVDATTGTIKRIRVREE